MARVAARRLLEFLKVTSCDQLYLVGDIVDSWQLRRRSYWHQTHNDVVQLVLKKAKKGCKVIFIPGNHDEGIRQFIGLDFGGILIRDEQVHETAKGQRMLVLHGDRFDGVICGPIHKPAIRHIDGIVYCNDGDWVENLSALVEDQSGALRLVTWHEIMLQWEQKQASDMPQDVCSVQA